MGLFLFCLWAAPAYSKKKADFDPSGRPEYDALLALLSKQGAPPPVQTYLMDPGASSQKLLMQVVRSCTTIGAGSSWEHTKFILKLDDAGKVTEARANSTGSLAICMERAWLGLQYKAPPFAPFYRLVILNAQTGSGV
jgi:hypothetical protein